MNTVLAAPADPRKCFEKRWAYQAMEAAIRRGDSTQIHRGGRGCGKTLSLCHYFHEQALQYPGMRQVWMRWERSKMTETVLATFEDEVLGIGHPLRSGPARERRSGYEYPNGSKIILMGISDDPDATKSLQADIIWVNECGQVPFGIWDEIGGASRDRVGLSPGNSRTLKIGDLNPMPPAHWTNSLAVPFPQRLFPRVTDNGLCFGEAFPPEKYAETQRYNLAPWDRSQHKHKLIQWFLPDNPGYWDFQAWAFFPSGLKYVCDRLGLMGKNLKARYLEGRPVAIDGAVYGEDFDREVHVMEPFDWPLDWPVTIAYDPGFRHPCAVDFLGVAPNGQPHFIDEIHAPGIGIDELGPMIKHKAARYRVVNWLDDPFGANQESQIGNGITVREYMRRKFGLYFQPWKEAKGPAKAALVEQLRGWLLMPKPLQIFETCPGIISNFESWMNKVNKDGTIPEGDERYEDRNNDGLDGLMGIVASNPVFQASACTIYTNE